MKIQLCRFLCLIMLTSFFSGCLSKHIKKSSSEQTPRLLKPAKIPDLEKELHLEINRIRKEHERSKLEQDDFLAEVARAHSKDMAKHSFFDHINTAGELPTARGQKMGYICRIVENDKIREGIAENIYKTTLYETFTQRGHQKSYDWRTKQEIAQTTVKEWMNSPGHAGNILNKDYAKSGVGIAKTKNNEILITHNFC